MREIGGPVECLRVKSEAEYVALAIRITAQLGGRGRIVETGEAKPVRVSDGRWVVDCDCGNGCLAHPGDGSEAWPRAVAICTECARVYEPHFPRGWRSGRNVLLARPHPRNRQWFPNDADARRHGLSRRERLGDLVRENREHGLPRRPPKIVTEA